MKKLPQRIWIDADSCWTEKPQGEGYTEYIRKDIVKQGKKEMLDKACKWLEENAGSYLLYPFCEFDKGALLEDFKKAMEGKK